MWGINELIERLQVFKAKKVDLPSTFPLTGHIAVSVMKQTWHLGWQVAGRSVSALRLSFMLVANNRHNIKLVKN
jgi:hypothetical protein